MSAPDQTVQQVRNLALLARQAIANQNTTMSVNPRMVADACLAFEAVLAAPNLAADTVSTARRLGELEAKASRLELELNAARSNVDALSEQIETRYREGVSEGVRSVESEVKELRAKLARLEATAKG